MGILQNSCPKNVTIWASRKARAPKTLPYGQLAKLEPPKHHHMGPSQSSSPKNVTIWAFRKTHAPKTSPYGHLAKLVPQKRHHMGISQSSCPKNVTIWASRKASAPKIGATACRAWARAEKFNGLQKVLQILCVPEPTTL